MHFTFNQISGRMAKKEFIAYWKEIERLMFEGVDCTVSYGISKWSDIWSSSFERQNILLDGKVVDFTIPKTLCYFNRF